MNFLDFCKAHGVIVEHLPPVGLWRRYPTEDKPRYRNGAVKYLGDHGFVQNHATMNEVAVWRPEKPVKLDMDRIRKDTQRVQEEMIRLQQNAVHKAARILDHCTIASHPYLRAKGFGDEPGRVWLRDGEQFLCIPMRVDGRLVGLQMIDEAGGKKFLLGQRTSEATFTWDNKGINILCEGYATSMSIRQILKHLKRRYTIHVCFSAGNMLKVARKLAGGIVVADNDASGTGERMAKEIGWPYYMPPEIGQDFNDLHQEVGNFRAGQELDALLRAK